VLAVATVESRTAILRTTILRRRTRGARKKKAVVRSAAEQEMSL
jgi:uncharacterized small protein (DUF1192 family)